MDQPTSDRKTTEPKQPSVPKRVLAHDLELLEQRAQAPALVVRKRMAILLEQRVNAGNTTIPRVCQGNTTCSQQVPVEYDEHI